MLQLTGITKQFAGQQVLDDIDLTVQQGEILCLLGPSGCGKTTLLRIIAGLERADHGDVRLDDASLGGKPVHQRDFGLMFQEFALFPHMTVRQNIAFGLRMRGERQLDERVRATLEMVGLDGFDDRDVTQLSGGERQRIALARSLAPRPRLLMLDEPLGSLDAALRDRLVLELRDIIKRVGLTAIYVTHDQQEAFAIADRVAVMNAGRVEQIDAPSSLYWRPKSRFVAGFLGLNNILPVDGYSQGCARTSLGQFPVDEPSDWLLLHPAAFMTETQTDMPIVQGEIIRCVFRGRTYRIDLQAETGSVLRFELTARQRHPIKLGDALVVTLAPEGVVPIFS